MRRARARFTADGTELQPTKETEALTLEIITEAIDLVRLREMAERRFGDMVKAVVDVEIVSQLVKR